MRFGTLATWHKNDHSPSALQRVQNLRQRHGLMLLSDFQSVQSLVEDAVAALSSSVGDRKLLEIIRKFPLLRRLSLSRHLGPPKINWQMLRVVFKILDIPKKP